MMQRSFKNEIKDEKIKRMVDEFISFYAKNINNESKPIKGIFEFLEWAKSKYFNGCLYKQKRGISRRFIKKNKYV